ncbi:2-succinyl-6-hydroxy-2,4-cyclohexadiene-1-carboxylate synthase [Staphylococcus simiae]|uniref:2-succinyl-6-hydroxy-2, 4-cyclohexadiene-1-carboxylate synthase n=1 Tax=Staphylococcus simiae TaxID=308354 RepID=UPI001A96F8EC|nr:2-succinyl-6-hydroxy-2,4-cyclohexadiene-1-carboxylate synthase [Staphylococcus simiae]MBO1198950.1 2-succinyl-6-hydroxy-2,4-cyclohexadiene-1-carboxylate synthase [Staphylococcus simiae]MBO1201147.1 2-succinyl-6-hydroxy-2,4-cyclohexadiene-1-carboxylate synthase [Staphylococcus simiae]MBO1203805.1 2-succinyl-6-hydroxy-2,4-cyclohexadiene-1-carboxylate synthase [Staphylococcus simiae]MBO1210798.1 2-succinyl-6-hydroxy-2,4-cyclohexadiene-1-carboxylate synthase [Staphylococcus simiae]MBO1229459.1 
MLNHNFYKSPHHTSQLIVLLHGFISDSRTFDNHIQHLLMQSHVLTIDLPGHGQDTSSYNEVWHFDFITKALDEVLSNYHDYQIYLCGYSMGGRVALYYAANRETLLSGLILESTTAGIEDEVMRQERVQVDHARANVLDIAGIEVFVNDWEQLPLFMSQQQLSKELQQQIRQQRLSQNAANLAKALRDYGTGHMPNLWPLLPSIKIPTLILAGEYDEKFVSIAQKMTNLMPKSKCNIISGVGHTIHVEDRAEFDTIILGFLKEEQNDY